MKDDTGKQAALLLPSLPLQALGQSQQVQAPACYYVGENGVRMLVWGFKYCGGKDVKKSCRWSNRGGCERALWCWHQAERRAESGNVVCNKEVWESMITSPEEQTTHIQPLWSGFNHNHSWKKETLSRLWNLFLDCSTGTCFSRGKNWWSDSFLIQHSVPLFSRDWWQI